MPSNLQNKVQAYTLLASVVDRLLQYGPYIKYNQDALIALRDAHDMLHTVTTQLWPDAAVPVFDSHINLLTLPGDGKSPLAHMAEKAWLSSSADATRFRSFWRLVRVSMAATRRRRENPQDELRSIVARLAPISSYSLRLELVESMTSQYLDVCVAADEPRLTVDDFVTLVTVITPPVSGQRHREPDLALVLGTVKQIERHMNPIDVLGAALGRHENRPPERKDDYYYTDQKAKMQGFIADLLRWGFYSEPAQPMEELARLAQRAILVIMLRSLPPRPHTTPKIAEILPIEQALMSALTKASAGDNSKGNDPILRGQLSSAFEESVIAYLRHFDHVELADLCKCCTEKHLRSEVMCMKLAFAFVTGTITAKMERRATHYAYSYRSTPVSDAGHLDLFVKKFVKLADFALEGHCPSDHPRAIVDVARTFYHSLQECIGALKDRINVQLFRMLAKSDYLSRPSQQFLPLQADTSAVPYDFPGLFLKPPPTRATRSHRADTRESALQHIEEILRLLRKHGGLVDPTSKCLAPAVAMFVDFTQACARHAAESANPAQAIEFANATIATVSSDKLDVLDAIVIDMALAIATGLRMRNGHLMSLFTADGAAIIKGWATLQEFVAAQPPAVQALFVGHHQVIDALDRIHTCIMNQEFTAAQLELLDDQAREALREVFLLHEFDASQMHEKLTAPAAVHAQLFMIHDVFGLLQSHGVGELRDLLLEIGPLLEPSWRDVVPYYKLHTLVAVSISQLEDMGSIDVEVDGEIHIISIQAIFSFFFGPNGGSQIFRFWLKFFLAQKKHLLQSEDADWRRVVQEATENVYDRMVQLLNLSLTVKDLREVFAASQPTTDVGHEIAVISRAPGLAGMSEQQGLVLDIERALQTVQFLRSVPVLTRALELTKAVNPNDADYGFIKRIRHGTNASLKDVAAGNEKLRELLRNVSPEAIMLLEAIPDIHNVTDFFMKNSFHDEAGKQTWEDLGSRITTTIGQDQFQSQVYDAMIEGHRCLEPFSRQAPSLVDFLDQLRELTLAEETVGRLRFAHTNIADVQVLFNAQLDSTSVNVEMRVQALYQSGEFEVDLRRLSQRRSVWRLKYDPTIAGTGGDTRKLISMEAEDIVDFRRQLGFCSKLQDGETSDVAHFAEVMLQLDRAVAQLLSLEESGHPEFFRIKIEKISLNGVPKNLLNGHCKSFTTVWGQAYSNRVEQLVSHRKQWPVLALLSNTDLTLIEWLLQDCDQTKHAVKFMIPNWGDGDELPPARLRSLRLFLHTLCGYEKALIAAPSLASIFETAEEGRAGRDAAVNDALRTAITQVRDHGGLEKVGRFLMTFFTLQESRHLRKAQQYYVVPESQQGGSTHVLGVLLHVYGEARHRPGEATLLWGGKDTTVDQVEIFFLRCKFFRDLRFVMIGIDRLVPNARDRVLEWQARLHAEPGPHADVLYIYTDFTVDNNKPFITKYEADVSDPEVLQATCRHLIDDSCIGCPKILAVHGAVASGKTHWVKSNYHDHDFITISMNDDVNVAEIMTRLAQVDTEWRTAEGGGDEGGGRPKILYLNVSAHAPPDQVNLLLFRLFFCGLIRNPDLGTVLPLPPACRWTVVIEIPSSKYLGADDLESTMHVHRAIPMAYFLCSDADLRFISADQAPDASGDLLFIAKYLAAFCMPGDWANAGDTTRMIDKKCFGDDPPVDFAEVCDSAAAIQALRTTLETVAGLQTGAKAWQFNRQLASLSPSATGWRSNCPGDHGLQAFDAPHQNFNCDGCGKKIRVGARLFGCRQCDHDLCPSCHSTPADKQTLSFLVSMLRRRFEAFATMTVRYNANYDNLGSTLMIQYIEEAVALCTPNFECSLEHWETTKQCYLVSEDGTDLSLRALYPRPTKTITDCVAPQLQLFLRGGESQLSADDTTRWHTMVAWGLGLASGDVAEVMARKQFVCTAEIALKLLIIHERRKAKCPLIIEGETGCGKSFPLEVYSLLINKAEENREDNERSVAPRIERRVCSWIQNSVLAGCQCLGETEEERLTRLDTVCQAESSDEDAAVIFKAIRSATIPTPARLVKYWSLIMQAVEGADDPEAALPADHPARGFVVWAMTLPNRYPLFKAQSKELADLYKPNAEEIEQFFTGTIQAAVGFSERLMGLLLGDVVARSVYHRMIVHPGVTDLDISQFLEPILQLSEQLEHQAAAIGVLPVEQVIFFDEMNTGRTIGLLKEIMSDRSFNGKAMPKSMFVCGAINPFIEAAADPQAVKRDDANAPEVHRHIYLVHRLPDVLDKLKVQFSPMKDKACEDYIRQRLQLFIRSNGRFPETAGLQGFDFPAELESSFVQLLLDAQSFFLELRNPADPTRPGPFGESSVSQREITRVFKLLPHFWEIADPGEKRRDNTFLLVRKCIYLSIALVYYLRLPEKWTDQPGGPEYDLRHAFARHGAFGGSFGLTFVEDVQHHIKTFVTKEHFLIPAAVALNQALLENIFSLVSCVCTGVPIGLVGPPGSSKTLAFHIVRDNLKGPNSPMNFCRHFDKIDTFFYQCSRYSTANDIDGVFRNAIARQHLHRETQTATRCVVFLDEAGLPEESKNSLKVLHPYLDDCEVSFVCISNQNLDAANANRMVKVFRSIATLDDLEVLALGCAGIDRQGAEHSTLRVVRGVCKAYLLMIANSQFADFFHYRDLIYLFRQLNRKRNRPGAPQQFIVTPGDLLQALEENFNGIDGAAFDALVKLYFAAVQAEVPDFDVPPQSAYRNVLEIIRDAFESRIAVGDDMAARFKLFIDPTGLSGSLVPLLCNCGLIRPDTTNVIQMSEFEGDQSDIHAAETISEIALSMETPGTNVLINTSRIDDSLYDLFNMNFRKTQANDAFTNIAIGSRTYPKAIHPDADFVIIVDEKDLAMLPAPFLSRFAKFRLDMELFLNLQIKQFAPAQREVIIDVWGRCKAFLSHMGASSFVGLGSPESALPIVLLSHIELNSGKPRFFEHTALTLSAAASDAGAPTGDEQTVEAAVRALVTRLLQICPPEILFLKLPGLGNRPEEYSTTYFQRHEHFNLRALIDQNAALLIAAAPAHGAGGEMRASVPAAGRHVVFARSSAELTDQIRELAAPAQSRYRVLHFEALSRARELEEKFAQFLESDTAVNLVIAVNARRKCDIDKVAQLVHALALGTKTVTILVAIPPDRLFFNRHPAFFGPGWDSHFLDAGSPQGSFMVKQFASIAASGLDDAALPELDDNLPRLITQLVDQFAENVSPFHKDRGAMGAMLLGRLIQDEGIRRFYNHPATGKEALQHTFEMHPFILSRLSSKLGQQLTPKSLFQMLRALAKKLAVGDEYAGFSDLIDRHNSDRLYQFFGAYLEHVVANYGLVALNNTMSEDLLVVIDDLLGLLAGADEKAKFRIKVDSRIIYHCPMFSLVYARVNNVMELGTDHGATRAACHTRLRNDQILANLQQLPVESRIMVGYARDLAVHHCVDDTVRPADEEALAVVIRYLSLDWDSSVSALSSLHHAAHNNKDDLRLLFSGFKSLRNLTPQLEDVVLPTQTSRPLFRRAFVTLLFDTLWSSLERIATDEDGAVDVDDWRKQFRFISAHFPPRNSSLRLGKAAELDARHDVMQIAHAFLSVPGLLNDQRKCKEAVVAIREINLGDGVQREPVALGQLVGVLKMISATYGEDHLRDMSILVQATCSWYCTEVLQKNSDALDDNLNNLFGLINGNHDDQLLLLDDATKAWVFSQAAGEGPSAVTDVTGRVERFVSDQPDTAPITDAGCRFLPPDHPGRTTADQPDFETVLALADILFEWLLEQLVTDQPDAMQLCIQLANGRSHATRTGAVQRSADQAYVVEHLIDAVQTILSNAPLIDKLETGHEQLDIFKDGPHWRDAAIFQMAVADGGVLHQEYPRRAFLAKLIATSGADTVALLFRLSKHPFAVQVASDLQRPIVTAKPDRLSFMNASEATAASAEFFPALHGPYAAFATVFNQCVEGAEGFAALCDHVAAAVASDRQLQGLQIAHVFKMFLMLKIFHDHWDDRTVLAGIENAFEVAGWNWTDEERAMVQCFISPDASIPNWAVSREHRITGFFATEDTERRRFRAFAVNITALALAAGEGHWLHMLVTKPQCINGSFIMGATRYDNVVNTGVHMDCMQQYEINGEPHGGALSFSCMSNAGLHFWTAVQFTGVAMHTLLFPERDGLYNEVFTASHVDELGHEGNGPRANSFTHGTEQHIRVSNFALTRAQTAYVLLGFNSGRDRPLDDTILLVNRVLERVVSASTETPNAFSLPARIDQQTRLSSEAYFNHTLLPQVLHEFDQAKLCLARQQNVKPVCQDLIELAMSEHVGASIASLRNFLAASDAAVAPVICRIAATMPHLDMLVSVAPPVTALYCWIHRHLAHTVPTNDINSPFFEVVATYKRTLKSAPKRDEVDRIVTQGCDAFNRFHAANEGIVGYECNDDQFFNKIDEHTPFVYVITTHASLAGDIDGGLGDGLPDMLYVILAELVKPQNDLAAYIDADRGLLGDECQEVLGGADVSVKVPLAADAPTGCFSIDQDEFENLVCSCAVDASQSGQLRFDLDRLALRVTQRYLLKLNQVDVELMRAPFQFRARKVSMDIKRMLVHGPAAEKLDEELDAADFPATFDEARRSVVDTALQAHNGQGGDTGEYYPVIIRLLKQLSAVSQAAVLIRKLAGHLYREEFLSMKLQDFVDGRWTAALSDADKKEADAVVRDLRSTLARPNEEERLPEERLLAISERADIRVDETASLHGLCLSFLNRHDYLYSHFPQSLRLELNRSVQDLMDGMLSSLQPEDRPHSDKVLQQTAALLVVLDTVYDDVRAQPDKSLALIIAAASRRGAIPRTTHENPVQNAVTLDGQLDGDLPAVTGAHLAAVTRQVLAFASAARSKLLECDEADRRRGEGGWAEVTDAAALETHRSRYADWLVEEESASSEVAGPAADVGAGDGDVGDAAEDFGDVECAKSRPDWDEDIFGFVSHIPAQVSSPLPLEPPSTDSKSSEEESDGAYDSAQEDLNSDVDQPAPTPADVNAGTLNDDDIFQSIQHIPQTVGRPSLESASPTASEPPTVDSNQQKLLEIQASIDELAGLDLQAQIVDAGYTLGDDHKRVAAFLTPALAAQKIASGQQQLKLFSKQGVQDSHRAQHLAEDVAGYQEVIALLAERDDLVARIRKETDCMPADEQPEERGSVDEDELPRRTVTVTPDDVDAFFAADLADCPSITVARIPADAIGAVAATLSMVPDDGGQMADYHVRFGAGAEDIKDKFIKRGKLLKWARKNIKAAAAIDDFCFASSGGVVLDDNQLPAGDSPELHIADPQNCVSVSVQARGQPKAGPWRFDGSRATYETVLRVALQAFGHESADAPVLLDDAGMVIDRGDLVSATECSHPTLVIGKGSDDDEVLAVSAVTGPYPGVAGVQGVPLKAPVATLTSDGQGYRATGTPTTWPPLASWLSNPRSDQQLCLYSVGALDHTLIEDRTAASGVLVHEIELPASASAQALRKFLAAKLAKPEEGLQLLAVLAEEASTRRYVLQEQLATLQAPLEFPENNPVGIVDVPAGASKEQVHQLACAMAGVDPDRHASDVAGANRRALTGHWQRVFPAEDDDSDSDSDSASEDEGGSGGSWFDGFCQSKKGTGVVLRLVPLVSSPPLHAVAVSQPANPPGGAPLAISGPPQAAEERAAEEAPPAAVQPNLQLPLERSENGNVISTVLNFPAIATNDELHSMACAHAGLTMAMDRVQYRLLAAPAAKRKWQLVFAVGEGDTDDSAESDDSDNGEKTWMQQYMATYPDGVVLKLESKDE